MQKGFVFSLGLVALAAGVVALAYRRRAAHWVVAVTPPPRGRPLLRPDPRTTPLLHGRLRPLPQPAPLPREAAPTADAGARPQPAPEPQRDAPPTVTNEDDRGRAAQTPAQIPAKGWKDILSRVADGISQHRILAIAAGVTFYALLAIFPAIAALVAIYSLFADPSTIRTQLDALSGVLPAGAISVMGDQIGRVASQGRATLGLATLAGLVVALWSANAGMKALFDALNIVYREQEKRSFLKLNAISLAFTVGGVALAVVSLAAVVALPPLLEHLPLPRQVAAWTNALRWPALLIVVTLAVSLVYRYGPSRDAAQWRWLSWGAAFFAIGWFVASLLFSWYAANFGSYNKTYGSLGAAVGFMTWIWITNIVLLVGAELNAEMEHQTARDTTEGPPAPLGDRGAAMADTIGPARG